ncbi:SDR family NAD(P)-dependent oxidoreductase [Brucella gallinifaecis]|uniref:SDR family oxidoreductase n=1 Tax=Brucella gallinifaecis TaxID=215590 RepID=A0A502BK75_9HYPH|nr:SDR family NAD(P)-dependent oxidoreductase [Brucella gallinifaecis]TPF74400.1 SDR family oxidoreductase [Brucella gallinifaecis]
MDFKSRFDLDGRVALVTGGASGLGLAMAEAVASAGAKVVIADLDGEAAANLAETFLKKGFLASAQTVNIAQAGAAADLVTTIVAEHGKLDIAFANAGISGGPGPFTEAGNLETSSAERWQQVLDVNLTGVFATIQAAAGPMRAQRWGRIIVTASSAGFRADPMVGYSYVATKAAVINLVKQAAIDLARFNVMVNAIAPGPFRTNIGGGRMHDAETEQQFAQSLPLGRVGTPEEIGGAALLLASEASSFITGAIIPVDGGAIAW